MNALKYSCSILVQLANIFRNITAVSYDIWILINLISTLFSYGWDIYMDWGLLRSTEKGKYGLRPKIMYNEYFYYFAAVSNLVMRFAWISGFMTPSGIQAWFFNSDLMIFFLSIVEAVRRL
jgi:hypothetical protein